MARSSRRVTASIIAKVVVAGVFVFGALAAPMAMSSVNALAATSCGQVLVPGSSWLGGHGVDVKSNGNYQGTGTACGGVNSPYTTTQAGAAWQCFELVNRLSLTYGLVGPGGSAAWQIPDNPGQMTVHNNGSGYIPVPGDLIVEWYTSTNSYGHVAIVDTVVGSTINAVEQNASQTGRHTYTISSSGSITGGYGAVRATMHFNHYPSVWSTNSTGSTCKNSGISGSVLSAGQYLCPGQQITSPSGPAGPANAYRLVLQSDGNLVEYSQFKALWASNTAGQTVQDAAMQGDGNFVLYTPSGTPIWASGTSGHPGSHLVLQGDANAVIYTTGGSPVWADGIVASFTQQLIVNTHNAYSVRVCGTNQYGSQVCNTWNTPNYTTDLSNWWWVGAVQIYAYSGSNGQGTYLGDYNEGPVGEAPGYWFSVTFA